MEVGGTKYPKRLSNRHPMLEAEVVFACRQEYAMTAVDVIARRTRLAFLDAQVSPSCPAHSLPLPFTHHARPVHTPSFTHTFLHTQRTFTHTHSNPLSHTPIHPPRTHTSMHTRPPLAPPCTRLRSSTRRSARTPQDIKKQPNTLHYTQASVDALPRVLDLMAKELKWSSKRKEAERIDALKFLETMCARNSATPRNSTTPQNSIAAAPNSIAAAHEQPLTCLRPVHAGAEPYPPVVLAGHPWCLSFIFMFICIHTQEHARLRDGEARCST